MLGDAKGNAPGGFLHLNKDFEIVGRWENDVKGMNFSYDFWYQPRHNIMVSTEWGAPKTFIPGFNLDDVAKNNYGKRKVSDKSVGKDLNAYKNICSPLEMGDFESCLGNLNYT